jgi:NDP-sugar pyrophosphorylase family protein
MTAYGICLIRRYIPGDPFPLTYGGGLSNIDINACIGSHRQAEFMPSRLHPPAGSAR